MLHSISSVISDTPVMAEQKLGLCPSVIFIFEIEELDLQATTSCALYPLALEECLSDEEDERLSASTLLVSGFYSRISS